MPGTETREQLLEQSDFSSIDSYALYKFEWDCNQNLIEFYKGRLHALRKEYREQGMYFSILLVVSWAAFFIYILLG